MNEQLQDHANVVVRPPLLYAGFLIAGWALGKVSPMAFGLGDPGPWIGGIVTLLGIGLAVWCGLLFQKSGTTVPTDMPTDAIVSRGPYRVSRNPIYVGLTTAYVGLAIVLDTWWPVILVPAVLVIMNEGVIKREEAYLARKFGQSYLDYKARVRRWI